MSQYMARLLLRFYPSKWRAQYGPELEELLCARTFRTSDIFNVLWSSFGERMRQPFARFCICSLGGSGLIFFICLLFAVPLWSTLSAPATTVLREQGAKPSFLVQVAPFESLEVVRLGVPALITAFVTFALVLVLMWIFFSHSMEIRKRRWAKRFILFSGTVFVLSSVLSFLAWQNGSLAKLLDLYPDIQNAPLLSVGHCFMLLAVSTIGVTLLLQIPIVTFYVWRLRAIQPLMPSSG